MWDFITTVCFCIYSPPSMFLSTNLLFQQWITRITMYVLYIEFAFKTNKICRGVWIWVTDSHCGVWCRELTIYLQYQDLHLRFYIVLTYWARVTHICVSKLTIIGSDNWLFLDWAHAIIRNNAGLILIWPIGTNFSEILIKIPKNSFKKMHVKLMSA